MNISWKQKNKQPGLLFRSWSGLAVLKSVTAPGKMAVTFNASCSAVMLRNDFRLGMSNVAGWLAYLEHLIITHVFTLVERSKQQRCCSQWIHAQCDFAQIQTPSACLKTFRDTTRFNNILPATYCR